MITNDFQSEHLDSDHERGDLYLTTFSRKTLSIFTFNNFSYKFLLMTQKRGELAGGLISKRTNKC